MSEIISNIVIEQTNLVFEPEVNNINITPDPINLTIYAGSSPGAAGSNTNVQFNELGLLQGSNSFTFDYATEIVNIGNLQITNVANLGGTANVVITGGANAYFLQTDGTGNLTWAPGTSNATGNGTAAGANTQIQFTDGAGNFQAAAGFTFDNASNVMNTPGDLIVAGNISATNITGNATNANFANYAGYVVNSSQSNITALGTLVNLTVAGTIAGNIINTTGNITGGNLIANGNFYGNVIGAASTAGTVTTNAQPNITSIGTLTGLALSGALNAAGQTITSNVANANTVNTVDLNVTGNANITFSNITVSGNVQAAQFISTVTAPTPPFVVNSSNMVPNLRSATAAVSDSQNFLGTSSNTNFYLTAVNGPLSSGVATFNEYVMSTVTFNVATNTLACGNARHDYVRTLSKTVGTLAAAGTAGAGSRAFVTDANLVASGNFGAVVGSGGSNSVPVYSDGTNWRIG